MPRIESESRELKKEQTFWNKVMETHSQMVETWHKNHPGEKLTFDESLRMAGLVGQALLDRERRGNGLIRKNT